MYSGKQLGEAIQIAIEKKGVKKSEVARVFGIKQPSLSDWIKSGRIGKQHIQKLLEYFSDVVEPSHFGIENLKINQNKITHLTEQGHTHMVDVSDKSITKRIAIAEGTVHFPPEVYAQIQASHGQTAKGTITEIARIAGIMAAKNTSNIIPLCHPMMLERCKIYLNYQDDDCCLYICAEVGVTHKTGVEMEALTAVSAAALTVYDMTKALSHDIVIGNIQLVHKSGGKSEFNR